MKRSIDSRSRVMSHFCWKRDKISGRSGHTRVASRRETTFHQPPPQAGQYAFRTYSSLEKVGAGRMKPRKNACGGTRHREYAALPVSRSIRSLTPASNFASIMKRKRPVASDSPFETVQVPRNRNTRRQLSFFAEASRDSCFDLCALNAQLRTAASLTQRARYASRTRDILSRCTHLLTRQCCTKRTKYHKQSLRTLL